MNHPDMLSAMRFLTRRLVRCCGFGPETRSGGWRSFPASLMGFRAGGVRRDLARELSGFSDAFAVHFQRTDAEFTGLAQSLRSLYESGQSLAALVSGRLQNVKRVLDQTRVAGEDGLAEASLQELREGLSEAGTELRTLESIGLELRRIRSDIQGIDQIGLFIRTTVMGFAVESARTEQCREAFDYFVKGLRHLGSRVTSVAAEVERHVDETRNAQAREWSTLSQGHAKLCRLTRELESAAAATAADAQEALGQTWRALQSAEQRMAQITGNAGEAVFYLQFGDIVRQKTEHISSALREAAQQFTHARSRREFRRQAANADRIIAIQVGQLELIQKEVSDARRQLGGAFEGVADATVQLLEILEQWRGGEPAAALKTSDPLGAFKGNVSRMETMHRQGRALRLEARRSTEQAVEASRKLAMHVAEIKSLNTDIHLQALNAIVKTATLGQDGATLSVLSMHVDSLHRESNQIVLNLVNILESMLRIPRGPGDRNGVGSDGTSEAGLREAIKRIDSAFGNFGTTFDSATSLIEQQREALESSRALLHFLGETHTAIAEQIRVLNGMREKLAPWIVTSAAASTRLDTLNLRYTMQSERLIHETAARANATGEPAGMEAPTLERPRRPDERTAEKGEAELCVPETAKSSDLGDNVELF